MSYFARLLEATSLRIGDAPPARPAVAQEEPAPADIVEMDADVEAALAPTQERPGGPAPVKTRAAIVDDLGDRGDEGGSNQSRPAAVKTPTAAEAHGREPAADIDRTAARTPLSEPALAAKPSPEPVRAGPQEASSAPPPATVTAEMPVMLQKVVEWVAAGSQPTATATGPAPVAEPGPGEASTPEADRPPDRVVSAIDEHAPPRPVPQRAEWSQSPAVAYGAEPALAFKERPVEREQPAAEAPLEEVVNISIGTISVRVDAPSAPAGATPPATPPAAPPRSDRPDASSSSRLQRRFLRP
jgi:hypothetical protein